MSIYAIKQPGYTVDVSSHGVGSDPDVVTVSPRPMALISRAVVAYYPNNEERYRCSMVADDPTVEANFENSRQIGALFGVYAYILQNKIQNQARQFIQRCQRAGLVQNGRWIPELPPVADVEIEYQPKPRKPSKFYIPCLTGAPWAAQVKEWLDTVEAGLGVRPWIYTAKWQWKWLCSLKNGTYTAPSWTNQYEYWIKYYPYVTAMDATHEIPSSDLPAGVTRDRVMLWQYEGLGRQRGFDFNDMNVFTDVGMVKYGRLGDHGEPAPEKKVFMALHETGDFPNVGETYRVKEIDSGVISHSVTMEEV